MLTNAEMDALSAFARYVDCYPLVRREVSNSPNMESIVAIANKYGFDGISCDLLKKMVIICRDNGWVWDENGRRWTDRLFVLSLAMISDESILDLDQPESGEFAEINYNEEEAEAFYKCVQDSERFQSEISCAKTIEDVVAICRRRGFRLRRVDFMIRIHKWDDDFFPWSKMSPAEAREFVYKSDLMVPPPPRLDSV